MEQPPRSGAEAVERARRIADEIARPMAEHVDAGHWPEEALRGLQKAGLGGMTAPVDSGGSGLGLRAVAEVCEALGTVCASTGITFGMHAVATAVIAAKATPAQTRDLLRPIAAGTHLTTLALSEPGTGSHFWLPQSQLRHTDDGFALDGVKSFVTSGGHADSYVVSTAGADDDALGRFSCVVVPGTAPGLEWQEPWTGIGMRGNSSRSVRLTDVRLGPDALLGAEGDQLWYVFEVVTPYFLMAMAGTYLGVAQAALDAARDHLGARRHSHTGRALSAEPVLQHRLGVLWAQVQRTRRLVHWAADEAERGGPDELPGLASAKAEVAECAVAVANEALTIVGGMGYRDRSAPERHLRDARAAHVMSPTTDVLRTWTGRTLLDLPLLGE